MTSLSLGPRHWKKNPWQAVERRFVGCEWERPGGMGEARGPELPGLGGLWAVPRAAASGGPQEYLISCFSDRWMKVVVF